MNICKNCGKEVEKKFCNQQCYIGWIKKGNAPFANHYHTDETKKNLSEIKLGKVFKTCKICGKKLKLRQDLYCCQEHRALGVKGKGNHFFGKHHKKKTIEGNRQKHIDKKALPETCRKMRLSAIKYRKSLDPGWHPSYNKEACKYFEEFDKQNNTKGQHAEKDGEYCIEDLGYYLDYINFDLKLIMEYDERRHYARGELKERDKIREQEIRSQFPDFEFRRIKEKGAD